MKAQRQRGLVMRPGGEPSPSGSRRNSCTPENGSPQASPRTVPVVRAESIPDLDLRPRRSRERKPRHRRSLLSRFINMREDSPGPAVGAGSAIANLALPVAWSAKHLDAMFFDTRRSTSRDPSRDGHSSRDSGRDSPGPETQSPPSRCVSGIFSDSFSNSVASSSSSTPHHSSSLSHAHTSSVASTKTLSSSTQSSSGQSTPNRPSLQSSSSDDTLRHADIPATAARKRNSFVRIHRADGSFGTVAVPLEATTHDLLLLAARKFFVQNASEYWLVVRFADRVHVIHPDVKIVMEIHKLLKRAGYTDRDNVRDVCREDLTFLGRIIFTNVPLYPLTERAAQQLERRPDRLVLRLLDLQTLPPVAIDNASKVETIDLTSGNDVLFDEAFLANAAKVRIFRAQRTFVDIGKAPKYLTRFSSLVHLDLSRNGLTCLDIDFTKLKNLRVLDIRGNRLESLPQSLTRVRLWKLLAGTNAMKSFKLCLPSLVDLDLSYNLLEELPASMAVFTRLERLNLCHNRLEVLPADFNTLNALVVLDVSENRLASIAPTFRPRLKVLRAAHNNPPRLPSSKIAGTLSTPNSPALGASGDDEALVSARQPSGPPLGPPVAIAATPPAPGVSLDLDVNGSRLIMLPREIQLTSVSRLDLRGMRLVTLPDNFFTRVPNVETLLLDNNGLSRLPLSIGRLARLRSLSASCNSLNSLPQEFYTLSHLEILDLHANNFKVLPPTIYALRSLQVFNISSNLLESLPPCDYSDTDSTGSMSPSHPASPQTQQSVLNANLGIPSMGVGPESRRSSTASVLSSKSVESNDTTDSHRHGHGFSSSHYAGPTSIRELYLADNRLQEDCFEEINLMGHLEILNLAYNEITEIPAGTFQHLPNLIEFYVSGNRLSTLPQDEFQHARNLKVFSLNSNRLHTLPAELSKVARLEVLDVASNNLRYNVSNWMFDWNWRWNKKLKYINFSSNRRLEIRRVVQQGVRASEEDMTDFCVLPTLQTLGLMDVTLMTPAVPDQNENCRVRTYGSDIFLGKVGIADCLGGRPLEIHDLVVDRFRGESDEALVGMFDGHMTQAGHGNKISKLMQEKFAPLLKQEMEQIGGEDTVADCLRRAFLSAHREIGNTALLSAEEIPHTFLGQHSTVAAHLTDHDRHSCTGGTILYFKGKKGYVVTNGGARVVLSRSTGDYHVLSEPVPLTSASELENIRAAGGIVSADGKLDGKLAYSRVIGGYTEGPQLSAGPSLYEFEANPSDMIIIGSEALWKFVSHETAADLARSESKDPMMAALKLRDFCLAYAMADRPPGMVMVVGIPDKSEDTRDMSLSADKKRRQGVLPEDSVLARLGVEVNPPLDEVTMVFTDIRHSTLLWETMPVVMRQAIKVHNSVMRRSIRLMGGYEVKTEGDAFIVSFHSSTEALLWCLTVQQQLLQADWPAELLQHSDCCPVFGNNNTLLYRGLSVRMGIHWGRPVHELDPITRRMDYFGPMVNRTARISAIAAGGQIAVSSDLLDMIQHEKQSAPDERQVALLERTPYDVVELGELKLKGIENPELISVLYPAALKQRHAMPLAASPTQLSQVAGTNVSTTGSTGSTPTPPTPGQVSRGSVCLPNTPPFQNALTSIQLGQSALNLKDTEVALMGLHIITARLLAVYSSLHEGHTILSSAAPPLLVGDPLLVMDMYATRIEVLIDALSIQLLAPGISLRRLAEIGRENNHETETDRVKRLD